MAKNDGYTKTGNDGLQDFANKISLIPYVGPWIAAALGGVSTLLESGGHLFKGDIGSAATSLVAGSVGNAVHAVTAGGLRLAMGPLGALSFIPHTLFWGGKALVAGTTGHTVGTHARALTENAIGAVTGALGVKPQVLRSHTAGVVGINGGFQSQRPGAWATQVSNQRGRNAGQDWRAHVEASRAEAQMGVQR